VARYTTPAGPPQPRYAIDDDSEDVNIQESIESADIPSSENFLSNDESDEYDILKTPNSKRRRLSPTPIQTNDRFENYEPYHEYDHDDTKIEFHELESSSSNPIISSPPAHNRPPPSATAPRFLISKPKPHSTPGPSEIIQQPAFKKPPRFRPQDEISPQAASEPLPEVFSPHRRGQKYLAGGLASEVRDWLMNLESKSEPATSALAGANSRARQDQWVVSLVVDEISGGPGTGMTLVRGRQVRSESEGEMIENLGAVKVILAGEGSSVGLARGKKASVGCTIGIKGPVWEVPVEGEPWGVGVDWKVL